MTFGLSSFVFRLSLINHRTAIGLDSQLYVSLLICLYGQDGRTCYVAFLVSLIRKEVLYTKLAEVERQATLKIAIATFKVELSKAIQTIQYDGGYSYTFDTSINNNNNDYNYEEA